MEHEEKLKYLKIALYVIGVPSRSDFGRMIHPI